MRRADRVLVSCEHAGNRVPRRYARRFRGRRGVLESHRSWDIGALFLARQLAERLGAPLHAAPVSRLVVDTNRSLQHSRLFSEFTIGLAETERQRILERYYFPHRETIERALARMIRRGCRVLHLAIHSFSPGLDPARERCDVGLLYDPARKGEQELSRRWRRELRAASPGLRIRRNFPYRGSADGLTTHLRRSFRGCAYLGIEVEVNQAHLIGPRTTIRTIGRALEESLTPLLAGRRGSASSSTGSRATRQGRRSQASQS